MYCNSLTSINFYFPKITRKTYGFSDDAQGEHKLINLLEFP